MDELYQQIVESYKKTKSVKKTSQECGTYPIKVRRVLITEGLWRSKTSDKIATLLNQGKTVSEIAEELYLSEKNVQSYMPYSRGLYGGEERSDEAIRSEEYRDRMRKAAKNQVNRKETTLKSQEDELKEQRLLREKLLAEKERLQKEKQQIWDEIEAEIKRIPVALQLHLELDLQRGYTDDTEINILRKYGRMQNGITRDFIVPGTMTLHGLHYAIMKAFGWQNSHLHSYIPYEEDFKEMTGCKVKEWQRLVGMYFRFPSGDFEDQYWDDDYEEGESFKSWLRTKYCAPYYYGGVGEHYLSAQMEVEEFKKLYPKIQKKSTDQRDWGIYFDGQCEEMLERPMIWTVLKAPDNRSDWNAWRSQKELSLKRVESKRRISLQKYAQISHIIDTISEKVSIQLAKNKNPSEEMYSLIEDLEKNDNEMELLCIENNPEPIPALSALRYRYDYGDGWEIRITCTNAWYDRSEYVRDENGNMHHDKNGFAASTESYIDSYGKQAECEFQNQLKEISRKGKPVCISWDGINLVDDVGGIGGFCEFLETINGNDPEKKKFYKNWAKSLGWTGRMPKPENLL